MRLVIDLQGAQTESRFRGIGRYSMALTRAIIRSRGGHEVIVILNGRLRDSIEPIRSSLADMLPKENIRVWYAGGPVQLSDPANASRYKAAAVLRDGFIESLAPDVVHVSSLFEGFTDEAVALGSSQSGLIPTVVTLYDLIPWVYPKEYLRPSPGYAGFYKSKVDELSRAQGWLAISESTATEGRKLLGLPPDKVINISAACDDVFSPRHSAKSDTSSRLGIDRSFVLYTGGADSRKNLDRLIQAYALLPAAIRAKHRLVMAGRMPDAAVYALQKESRRAGLDRKDVVFTGFVSDHDLAELYRQCAVFVFPSRHEGFGLPALEAMSCGAPTIGANTTSVPEVISDERAMFNPYSVTDMATKITRVLTDAAFSRELSEAGKARAQHFSWDSSARIAWQMFEQVQRAPVPVPDRDKMVQHLISRLCPSDGFVTSKRDLLQTAIAIDKNHPVPALPTIFVDISELVQRDVGTGVQRVTRSILNVMIRTPPAGFVVEPVYSTMTDTGYRYARAFKRKTFEADTDADLADELINPGPGDIFFGLDLQHHVVLTQLDYLVNLRERGTRLVFVLYDLLPVVMPQFFSPGMEEIHARWLGALAHADAVLAISKAVAEEYKQWLVMHLGSNLPSPEVDWFHLGADLSGSVPSTGLPVDSSAVLSSLAVRTTFLMVGTVEPRKGHSEVLAAFTQLWERGVDVNLVIVGMQGWQVEALAQQIRAHSEHGTRLWWIDSASDEYLDRIYALSDCLVAASFGEGFGLPLIEAAQHGIRVIARDIPVFREVAGDACVYFGSPGTLTLAQAVERWVNGPHLPIQGNVPTLSWLTWKEAVAKLEPKVLGLLPAAVDPVAGNYTSR